MNQSFPVKIPDFQLNFENIQLFVKDMEIDTVIGMGPEEFKAMIPYSLIRSDMHTSGFVGTKDVVGMIYETFRVDGEEPNMAFEIEAHIRARPKSKSQPADTLNKAVQYLYEWLEIWIKKNEILDTDNQPVKLPLYLYSRAHFEKDFPDEDWGL
jgi:hypothetical protein